MLLIEALKIVEISQMILNAEAGFALLNKKCFNVYITSNPEVRPVPELAGACGHCPMYWK